MFLRRWRSRKLGIIIVTIIIAFIVINIMGNILITTKKKRPLQVFHGEKLPDTVDVHGLPSDGSKDVGDVVKEESRTDQMKEEQVFFPMDRPLSGYIVYDCSKQHRSLCGGWSDRMSGIISTFGIAIISRRHFKIRHDNPCTFDNLLEPNKYDWKFDQSKIPTKSEYMSLIDNDSHNLRVLSVNTKHLENAFKQNVTFIRMNWDITQDFRKRQDIAADFPWISKLQYADIYSGLFHYLFKPGKTMLDKFADFQKRRKHKLLACSHSRAGDIGNKPRDFSKIWKFLSKLDRSRYDIFIASDQQYVRDAGIKYLEGYDILTTSGKLGNMDRGSAGCDEFMASMVDFHILTTCDLLVITDSGFSILSAYVRATSDNLYCMGITNDVFPCSRYVLEDVYPGNMLAAKLN